MQPKQEVALMAKFKKVIVAGPLVVECIYPAPNPRDSVRARQGKKALSSEAQRRMNLKYAWQKLELLIAANFGVKDLWITFTYDDAHLPSSRKEANAIMKAFLRKLRAARLANGGLAFQYIYVTEHKHGDGRWHHHVLINATGEDFELIRKLWIQGGVEIKPIRIDKDKNFETLARYMCKEQRDKVGLRLWSGSRNLKKPERECWRVPDDTPLAPPTSSPLVLEDTGDVTTAYGHYRYVKYLAAGWHLTARPKAKRKRGSRRLRR